MGNGLVLTEHAINPVPNAQTMFKRFNMNVRTIRAKSFGNDQVHHLDQWRVLLVTGRRHAAFAHRAAPLANIHLRLG